jgi:hypothetical protein
LWLDESAHARTRSELRGASCEDWKTALRPNQKQKADSSKIVYKWPSTVSFLYYYVLTCIETFELYIYRSDWYAGIPGTGRTKRGWWSRRCPRSARSAILACIQTTPWNTEYPVCSSRDHWQNAKSNVPSFEKTCLRLVLTSLVGISTPTLNPGLTRNSKQTYQPLVYKFGNISSEILSGSIGVYFHTDQNSGLSSKRGLVLNSW